MPHHRIRPRVDDMMMFLAGDRAGPEPAEMKTGPPREREADHSQREQQPADSRTHLPQYPSRRSAVEHQNRADHRQYAIDHFTADGRTLDGSFGPSRGGAPRDQTRT